MPDQARNDVLKDQPYQTELMKKYSKKKTTKKKVEVAKDNSKLPKYVRRLIYSFLPFKGYNKALKLSKSERDLILSEDPYWTFQFSNRDNNVLRKDIPDQELKDLLHKIAIKVDIKLFFHDDFLDEKVCLNI